MAKRKISRRKFLIGAAVAAGGAYMTSKLITRAPSVVQIRYRLKRVGGTWTKPLAKEDVLDALRRRASKHAPPFRLKREDNDWGRWRPLDDIIARLRDVLPKVPVGTTYRVQSQDKTTWVLKKVEIDLTCVSDTSGTPAIDKIHCTVARNFPGVESWGICNCRKIAGSSTYSQHAFCNAEDFHHDDPDQMQRIANFLVANAIALDVAEVIYNGRIWTREGGWRAYTGVNPHKDHVHVSGYPLMTGTPPCAGG